MGTNRHTSLNEALTTGPASGCSRLLFHLRILGRLLAPRGCWAMGHFQAPAPALHLHWCGGDQVMTQLSKHERRLGHAEKDVRGPVAGVGVGPYTMPVDCPAPLPANAASGRSYPQWPMLA